MKKKLMSILTAATMLASLAAAPVYAESSAEAAGNTIPKAVICSADYQEDGTPKCYYLLMGRYDICKLSYNTMLNLLTEDSAIPQVGDALECATAIVDTYPGIIEDIGEDDSYIKNLGNAVELYGEEFCQEVAYNYWAACWQYTPEGGYYFTPESDYFLVDESRFFDAEYRVSAAIYRSDGVTPDGFYVEGVSSVDGMYYISDYEVQQQLAEGSEMPVVGDVLNIHLYSTGERHSVGYCNYAERTGSIENHGSGLELYGEDYEASRLQAINAFLDSAAEKEFKDFYFPTNTARATGVITPNSGDSNLDGEVTIVDVVKTCRCAMGADTVPAIGVLAGDINEDGVLDATDASVTIRSLVGLE